MPYSVNKEVAAAFAKQLWSGVKDGYGKNTVSIAYNSPDDKMLNNLQNNVYNFSAAKNYQQLKALTQAMIGDDGKLRSYSQFKNEAFAINDAHVNNWLKTEYDTAVASGQMASKWADIQANKKLLPLLQFDAVMDARTSAICSSLNGVVKPVDDPFWNMYYPPNHFGCRSTVRQKSGGAQTPDHAIVHPEKVPEMFKTNLAKQGLVFPPAHPYWIGIPDEVIHDAGAIQNNDITKWAKQNVANKIFTVDGVGKVSFTNRSIKELIHKPHQFKLAKNQTVYRIKDILKNAELVQISPDAKGNENVKQWYYLRFTMNGKASFVNIREMLDGTKTVYAITDALK